MFYFPACRTQLQGSERGTQLQGSERDGDSCLPNTCLSTRDAARLCPQDAYDGLGRVMHLVELAA